MKASQKESAGPGLRERILAASTALLESEGLAALSMREVARRAGVTHQAPYHHFKDREAILAALVEEGFLDLSARLREARRAAGEAGPQELLLQVGLAYVGFALARSGIFRIMFRPELVQLARAPEAAAAGMSAYQELREMVARLGLPGPSEVEDSLHWSFVHGLSCLLVDGALGRRFPSPEARDAHVREVLRAFASRRASPTPDRAHT